MPAKKIPAPWDAPQLAVEEVAAIKACAQGTAEPHQAKLALDAIVHKIAGTYDRSFMPGDAAATGFAEGKRHVGRQIVGFANIDIEKFRDADRKVRNG